MAFTYTPTYITHDDFKDQTIVSDLETVSEADFDKLVSRAEIILDNYVGVQTKYDESGAQTRQFPRSLDVDANGNSFIPDEIEMATARIIEALYKEGETKSASQNSMISERIDDYSYTKDKSASMLGGINLIPPEAQQLLSKFRKRGVQLSPPTVSDSNVNQLNSRQKFLRTLR